jgi:hypothetical protein
MEAVRGQRVLVIMVVAGVLAGSTSAVAWLDHRHKGRVMNRLQANEWYCAHRSTRCGEAGSARVEEWWETRERVYVGVVGAATVAFAVAGVALVRLSVLRGRRASGSD